MSVMPQAAVHDAAMPAHEGNEVDWARIRADFPLLMREVHGKPLVYFDNANTGQKPLPVIVMSSLSQAGSDHALEALRADHEFLLKGDVFTPDVIDTWIWYKHSYEIEALRVRPHPYEFSLYYDV